MSEFSEVYFLRSNEQDEAILLLKKAGVQGYVYPVRDGWATFAANTSPLFKFSEKLKEANKGILMQFVNAEDHGWGFEVCVGNKSVCGYYYEIESEKINREIEEKEFELLLKQEDGKFRVLKKYFDKKTKIEDIINPQDFTQDMKLYFTSWISYHYAELENGEFEKYGDYDKLKLVKVN